MGEVKLLTDEQKAALQELAETVPDGEYEWVVTGPLTDEEAGIPGGVPAVVKAVVYEKSEHSDFFDYHDIAECVASYRDEIHAQFIVAAQPRHIRALLTELETTERHRHQSHEDLHRALLQIEEMEAVNASLRRDLAAARDETQAMALTVMRDESPTGQA